MRILHVLSQRPGRTGSGVTLDALVREAARAGSEQQVVVGTPASDPTPAVGGLAPAAVHPLVFESAALPFPLPGMSDVMPYPSSRWADLTTDQLTTYREAWRRHVVHVLSCFRPHVVHSHHLWLLSSLLKDAAPHVPVVTQSHATGLRQMVLCPHLADEVRRGCARNDRILTLTRELRRSTMAALDVDEEQVEVVGAGYRDDLFHPRGRAGDTASELLYVGKYSHAKGLPWLLDAVDRLLELRPTLRLHVAGSGGGAEADALRERMRAMAPRVVLHGHVEQPELAALMRRCGVFVLPSFYEGLPLVVVEAAASGCRVVCTDLPTVREELAPKLGGALDLVPLPRLEGVDAPRPEDLPAFVDALERTLGAALDRGPLPTVPAALPEFTWRAVHARVDRVWRRSIASRPQR